MIRIDDTLLEEIGLIALPKQDRDQLLRQIYETLEMRVGMRLAERMTDQQLDEFERFIDTNDEAGALKWLETNFPDYKQVVADELEKLKGEIKKDAPKIIQTMQAQGGQAAAGLPQPQAPPADFGGTPAPAPQFTPPAPQPFQTPQPAPQQPLQPLPAQPTQPQPQTDFGASQPLTPIAQNDQPFANPVSPTPDDNSPQQPQPPMTAQDSGVIPPPPGL